MTGPVILFAQAQGPGVAAIDAPIPVPSGQEVRLLDVIRDQQGPGGLTYRFRFVAPAIADAVDFETAVDDMAHLCRTYALPRLPEIGPIPAQVVISLADRPVAFGEPAPEAIQFFEAFSIEGDDCIWEAF